MGEVRLVVHGHFYQPPRENPWTEDVAMEPSAAPFHDWNERITAECYRPNGWARVLDEHGRVTEIVDNYEHLSFDVGPTLLSWLEVHRPEVYERMLEADRAGGGAIAQGYSHMILPLANDRDVRTQVRWGLADFEHRFGRPARGMWLPETAVNDDVLRVLVEEGVGFTILAPTQAATSVDGGEPYRWLHPDGSGRSITIVFYDGAISHDLAFGLTGLSSQELIRRVVVAAEDGTPVCVATDGETFGHHHKFADRALAYAFSHEAHAAGVRVLTASQLVDEVPAVRDMGVHESAWSCAHGVRRWTDDCGCHTGGAPGWNQSWRAPLREALDIVRDHGAEAFDRRGREVLHDPWAARDAYVEVILGRRSADEFLAVHSPFGADRVVARTLLEAQRHALLMYTSCGWFFNDLAGIETLQVLRYAARAIDLLDEVGEPVDIDRFLDVLGRARSNVEAEGDGRAIWQRHIEPSRVDADRVVAHLALISLLEDRDPPSTLTSFVVEDHQRRVADRGGRGGVAGQVTLVHRRTGRRTDHVYAAIHLGGLEVFGATRASDPERDPAVFSELARAGESGARVTTLLRLIAEDFGPHEFALDSALPDAAGEIVRSAAAQLADRFGATYDRLYGDNRQLLDALVTAGYPLPPELRAPAELALARRFEAEIAKAVDSDEPDSFETAQAIAREARHRGFHLATPSAAAIMGRTLLTAVERAVEDPESQRIAAALQVLRLTRHLGLTLDIDRSQELVLAALDGAGGSSPLRVLAGALGIRTETGSVNAHHGEPGPDVLSPS
jgi:alpha-amylase/alpha-mannosidase (GH57 family)